MKALRFWGVGDLRLEEVAEPELRDGEVSVAVEACGVCGSDLHFLDGTARTAHTPITLGQEFSGYVSQLDHGLKALINSLDHLTELALGGTAVGTGINTPEGYAKSVARNIARFTDLPL